MGDQLNAYLTLPKLDLRDVDMDIVRSPARREMLRKEIHGSEAA